MSELTSLKVYQLSTCLKDKALGKKCQESDYCFTGTTFKKAQGALVEKGFKITKVNDKVIKAEKNDVSFDFRPCSGGSVETHVKKNSKFTMDAIWEDENGQVHNPIGGLEDLMNKVLRTTSGTKKNGTAIRSLRYMVTHDMNPTSDLVEYLRSQEALVDLKTTSNYVLKKELAAMMEKSVEKTLSTLSRTPLLRDYLLKQVTL